MTLRGQLGADLGQVRTGLPQTLESACRVTGVASGPLVEPIGQAQGCYAYSSDHLGESVSLRQLSDHSGPELVDRFFELSVSIDGLQPEHDARRKPATYDRILKHIDGHQVTVHCTVTRQQTRREGYLQEFVAYWSGQTAVKRILMSLYTPQVGEVSTERLTAADRSRVVSNLLTLRAQFPKLAMPRALVEVYGAPPTSPTECIFAQTTTCISADLDTVISPCQFGGTPDCTQCGCVASASLAAIGRHELPGGLRVESLFEASLRVGSAVRSVRTAFATRRLTPSQ